MLVCHGYRNNGASCCEAMNLSFIYFFQIDFVRFDVSQTQNLIPDIKVSMKGCFGFHVKWANMPFQVGPSVLLFYITGFVLGRLPFLLASISRRFTVESSMDLSAGALNSPQMSTTLIREFWTDFQTMNLSPHFVIYRFTTYWGNVSHMSSSRKNHFPVAHKSMITIKNSTKLLVGLLEEGHF